MPIGDLRGPCAHAVRAFIADLKANPIIDLCEDSATVQYRAERRFSYLGLRWQQLDASGNRYWLHLTLYTIKDREVQAMDASDFSAWSKRALTMVHGFPRAPYRLVGDPSELLDGTQLDRVVVDVLRYSAVDVELRNLCRQALAFSDVPYDTWINWDRRRFHVSFDEVVLSGPPLDPGADSSTSPAPLEWRLEWRLRNGDDVWNGRGRGRRGAFLRELRAQGFAL